MPKNFFYAETFSTTTFFTPKNCFRTKNIFATICLQVNEPLVSYALLDLDFRRIIFWACSKVIIKISIFQHFEFFTTRRVSNRNSWMILIFQFRLQNTGTALFWHCFVLLTRGTNFWFDFPKKTFFKNHKNIPEYWQLWIAGEK